MAAGSDGRVILAGTTDESWGATVLGDSRDFVAAMLETPTVATSAPSAASTPAPTAVISPARPSGEGMTLYTTPMKSAVVSAYGWDGFRRNRTHCEKARKVGCWGTFCLIMFYRAARNVLHQQPLVGALLTSKPSEV